MRALVLLVGLASCSVQRVRVRVTCTEVHVGDRKGRAPSECPETRHDQAAPAEPTS